MARYNYDEYNLIPEYDNSKSFYGKAKVTVYPNGTKVLTSYKTEVAAIMPDGSFRRLWNGYSATTSRHVNEFRLQNGLAAINKTEWIRLPLGSWNVVDVIKAVAV